MITKIMKYLTSADSAMTFQIMRKQQQYLQQCIQKKGILDQR